MKKRKRKSHGRMVQWQRTSEIVKSKYANLSGETSPYWDWVRDHSRDGLSEECSESPIANPDRIEADENYQERRTELNDQLEWFVKQLSPRELQVFAGLKYGMTEQQIADYLEISRSMVKLCRNRMKIKFDSYDTKQP